MGLQKPSVGDQNLERSDTQNQTMIGLSWIQFSNLESADDAMDDFV